MSEAMEEKEVPVPLKRNRDDKLKEENFCFSEKNKI